MSSGLGEVSCTPRLHSWNTQSFSVELHVYGCKWEVCERWDKEKW